MIDIPKLVQESRITSATIAEGIGMKRATFNNKLKGNNGSFFTPEEQHAICEYLKVRIERVKDILDGGTGEL